MRDRRRATVDKSGSKSVSKSTRQAAETFDEFNRSHSSTPEGGNCRLALSIKGSKTDPDPDSDFDPDCNGGGGI
jgi:hypothetical protein